MQKYKLSELKIKKQNILASILFIGVSILCSAIYSSLEVDFLICMILCEVILIVLLTITKKEKCLTVIKFLLYISVALTIASYILVQFKYKSGWNSGLLILALGNIIYVIYHLKNSHVREINKAIDNFNQRENGKIKILYNFFNEASNVDLLNTLMFTKKDGDFDFIEKESKEIDFMQANEECLEFSFKKNYDQIYWCEDNEKQWKSEPPNKQITERQYLLHGKLINLEKIIESDIVIKIQPEVFRYLTLSLVEEKYSNIISENENNSVSKYVLEVKQNFLEDIIPFKFGGFSKITNCTVIYYLKYLNIIKVTIEISYVLVLEDSVFNTSKA